MHGAGSLAHEWWHGLDDYLGVKMGAKGFLSEHSHLYRILTALERAMDLTEFDVSQIGPEALGVSQQRWARYIEMMQDVGYIKGALIKESISGDLIVDAREMRITLKGLEYLQENGIMQRIYRTAKGIKEITPGI